LMGSAIAYDLLQSNSVTKVAVVDSSLERLKALEFKASKRTDPNIGTTGEKLSDKLELIELDIVKKKEDLQKLLPKFDVGVGALPHELGGGCLFRA